MAAIHRVGKPQLQTLTTTGNRQCVLNGFSRSVAPVNGRTIFVFSGLALALNLPPMTAYLMKYSVSDCGILTTFHT